MEQVLAPIFKFKTRADADELDGSRRESDIVYTGDDNIIAIRGFAEPSSARTRQILESDLNDLSAAIFQDEAVLRAAMNPDEYAPEVVNQVFIPKVIARQYPDLSAEEVEEVRQAVVANAVFKSPSVSIEQQGDTQFVRMPALTIAALYKRRWQVELFFKWIKQHLRIKRFIGNSENAVKTQIWCAIATCVLIAIVKKELKIEATLYTLLQILPVSVFEKTPLSQAFAGVDYISEYDPLHNQLNLFDF